MMNNMPTSVVFKRLFKYLTCNKIKYIFCQILGLVSIVIELMGPVILSKVINDFTAGSMNFNRLIFYALSYLLFSVLASGILSLIQKMTLAKIGEVVVYNMREDIFMHIMGLSHKEFSNIPTGVLITRITSDAKSVSELFTKTLTTIIRNISTLITALIIMIIISIKLSLIVLAITPILLILTILFAKYSKYKYSNVRNHQTALNVFVSENIDGVRVVKAYNKEDKQYVKFNELNKKLCKVNIEQTVVFAIFRPLIYSIHLVCVLLLLYYGGSLVIKGAATAGTIVVFYSYSSYYFDPIQEIAEQLNSLSDSISSAEKIFNLLDIKASVELTDDGIKLDSFNGEIEFKNVYFRYNSNQNYILENISFKINPGETIALVGPTGGGKSTIINLIMRNYEIESGEILIDGINIKDINIKSLRRNIGYMLQDVHLFSGTVMENIKLFDSDINDEMVYDASRLTSFDMVVDRLDNKYDSYVHEKGENFSQGERQLMSFARAVASHPKMMILDEATANIDSKTESVIQNSLESIKNLGTMIIVAHRLSTIKHANRIFVINHGRIEEDGSHDDLMKKEGMYYNLYISQYKGV